MQDSALGQPTPKVVPNDVDRSVGVDLEQQLPAPVVVDHRFGLAGEDLEAVTNDVRGVVRSSLDPGTGQQPLDEHGFGRGQVHHRVSDQVQLDALELAVRKTWRANPP